MVWGNNTSNLNAQMQFYLISVVLFSKSRRWKQLKDGRAQDVSLSESAVALSDIYKLGYVKGGSTTFKVHLDGYGILSAARALLGPKEH